MEFTLKINLDNAAFNDANKEEFGTGVLDCAELHDILTKLVRVNFASVIRVEDRQRPVMDSNGNTVGYWEVTE